LKYDAWFVLFSQGKLQALTEGLRLATKPNIAYLTRQSTGIKNLWRFCAVALKLHFSTKAPQVFHPVIATLQHCGNGTEIIVIIEKLFIH
jgi:hypothetical protein